MIKNIFFSSLNKALNAYLNLDAESKKRVDKLSGKIVGIEFLPLHFSFQCTFDSQGMHVSADNLLQNEVVIRGTPLQMLSVMTTKDRQRFFAEDIVIEGDAELAQQVIELFDHLKIDWEEYFSQLAGDAPAYYAGRFLNKVNSWLNKTKKSMSQNINEYVHEEMNWVPSREALQDFFSDIDTTRMDVDRMEARIKNLFEKN